MITNKLKFHNRMIVSPFFQLDLRSARSMMGVVNVSNEISARASRAINIMLTYSENSAGALGDGAPVMCGSRNGVAKRLTNSFPKLISIHCVNHRLALAAAHAADDIPYLIKFKATVQTLFLFYQNSAVRMAGLHVIQEVLDEPVIKLKQAKDVRWLS